MSKKPEYDLTKPPAGFGNEFHKGDLSALQALADWYRDRGQAADPEKPKENPSDHEKAYWVEVYRDEVAALQERGRQLRERLRQFPALFKLSPYPLSLRGRTLARVNKTIIEVACGEYAIPVNGVYPETMWVHASDPTTAIDYRVESGMTPAIERRGFLIYCPTDHKEEGDTEAMLRACLKALFPQTPIRVCFQNAGFEDGGKSSYAAARALHFI